MDPAMVEAIQQIKFDGKDKFQLAEQAKNHGNQLFKYGKKNINQYRYAITSYTVSGQPLVLVRRCRAQLINIPLLLV